MQEQFYQAPIQKRFRVSEFRSKARTALAGHWWLVIGVFLVASIPLVPALTRSEILRSAARPSVESFGSLKKIQFNKNKQERM